MHVNVGAVQDSGLYYNGVSESRALVLYEYHVILNHVT